MKFRLHLRYVYTFYNFGEILQDDVFDEHVDIEDKPKRFTLHDQEDGSFILSEVREDYIGKHVVMTFPNKDTVLIREGKETELAYDEYYSVMGDDNHNVYVGSVTLVKV